MRRKPSDSGNASQSGGGGFWKLPASVAGRTDLSMAAKVVYAYLADRQGDNGSCWPGQRRIATDCGTTAKAVNRAIGELRQAGLIDAEPGQMRGPRNARTCRYRVCSERSNVVESHTFETPNVIESNTLNGANVVESTTLTLSNRQRSTLSNRQQIQTQSTDPETRESARAARGAAPGLFGDDNGDGSNDRAGRTRRRGSKATGGNGDGEPDRLTSEAVALWCDTYAEARGAKPDRIDGRAVGVLRRLAHERAGGELDVLRARLRLAAGLDGRAAPWPFDKPGELTVAGVARHWDKLGDALRAASNGNGNGKARPAFGAGASWTLRENVAPLPILNASEGAA